MSCDMKENSIIILVVLTSKFDLERHRLVTCLNLTSNLLILISNLMWGATI